MSHSCLNLAAKLGKLLLVLSLVSALHPFATAQKANQDPKAALNDPTKPEDNKDPFSPIEEEMKAKRAIKEVDREYQENLDRARDLSSLGTAIVTSFREKNGLNSTDIKKLEKVEKLAKGIRRAAGGSEDNFEMDEPPKDLSAAMAMLSDLSQSLKAKVEKTPKHVISATVIDEANVLLELIRIVRSLPAKV
ncbi:MAG: hypothetical protein ABJC10_05705 [Acidobacteriota bacterium]